MYIYIYIHTYCHMLSVVSLIASPTPQYHTVYQISLVAHQLPHHIACHSIHIHYRVSPLGACIGCCWTKWNRTSLLRVGQSKDFEASTLSAWHNRLHVCRGEREATRSNNSTRVKREYLYMCIYICVYIFFLFFLCICVYMNVYVYIIYIHVHFNKQLVLCVHISLYIYI